MALRYSATRLTRAAQPLAGARALASPHVRPLSMGVIQEQKSWNPPGRVVVITSGKGGVGKTTVAASFAYGLAARGHKTCVVDFDIGLRNLDLHLGAERRVIFDFVNVMMGECNLNQALIKDRRNPNLHLLAASQTWDKDVLTLEGTERILGQLKQESEYVALDSPAWIEAGARLRAGATARETASIALTHTENRKHENTKKAPLGGWGLANGTEMRDPGRTPFW